MLHSDLHSRLDDLNTRVLALENEKRDLASALSTAKQSIKQAQGVSQCRIEAVEAKYTAQRKIVMALEVCCCSITSNANSTLA
jgi:chaperonin cofactor prefoldin